LRDADLIPDGLDGVVLVGGATRKPQVRRAVEKFFGRSPLTDIDPDEAVAIGAAIQADTLAGNRDDGLLLLDVIPLSLGLETMGGLAEKLVPRNSTIPVARAQDFTTFKDGQTAMSLHVVQGERDLVADCRSLARFELCGIPPMAAGVARVRVTFQVDADGLLGVTAREQTTGVEAAVAVKPSYGLTDEEISGMLRASLEHARDDIERRARAEARVEAERMLEALQGGLQRGGEFADEAERERMLSQAAKLRGLLEQGEASEIRIAAAALNRSTEEFAARQMDAALQRALSGRSIEQLVALEAED